MSESAVVYNLCGFYSVMPGTCQSHQKWEKAAFGWGFFFSSFFQMLTLFFFVFCFFFSLYET